MRSDAAKRSEVAPATSLVLMVNRGKRNRTSASVETLADVSAYWNILDTDVICTAPLQPHERPRKGAACPRCIVQLCHVHFLENIRRTLKVRSEEQYRTFVVDIEELLFSEYLNAKTFKRRCFELFQKHMDDSVKIATLQYIAEHRKFLTGYVKAERWHHNGCPRTTNLIESCNKQLQGRLKTIQGFESFHTAERWLSA